MAAVQKRRTTSRIKNQKSAKLAAANGAATPRAWVRDSISLVLLAGGLLMLLSLASHSYTLASGMDLNPHGNIMGPSGHVVATLLVGTLGVAAVLPVMGLVWLAFFRWGSNEERQRRYSVGIVCLASVLLVACSTGLLAMVGGEGAGGTMGSSVLRTVSRNIGSGGTLMLLAILLSVSVAILLQRSVGDVAHGIRIGGQWLLTWLCWKGPRLVAVLLVQGGSHVAEASRRFGAALAGLFASRGAVPSVAQESFKPKPRRSPVPAEPEGAAAAVSRVSEPAAVSLADRVEPIIVKPRPPEAIELRTLRPQGEKKKPVAEKDAPPQAAPQFSSYVPPELKLLAREEGAAVGEDDDELRQKAEQIETKLRDFNIAGRVTQVHPGPVITLFEFEPAAGVKVGRIAALQDDLAMSLKASSIRIIAPIPKRGTVGIEVPNKNRAIVRLRDCLESPALGSADSILSVPLGKDTYGESVVVDIATMPHLLMAGATGTGKSVSINAILLSLLYRAHPSELGLILIDPKVLELSVYDGIPHLRVPVVTDPRQAKAVLSWAVKEMDRRYRFMQRFGVRNIDGYNRLVSGETGQAEDASAGVSPASEQLELISPEQVADTEPVPEAPPEGAEEAADSVDSISPEQLKPLPKIVIVIDELADLMLTVGREIEELITRLAQKARAAGIHLIVATQRPSVDVITGLIKANFPARLSFRVSSRIDSRTILDAMGAEKLLGRGDMLFMLPGAMPLKRIHGAYVEDEEVQRVVASLKVQCQPQYDEAIIAACDKALAEESGADGDGAGGEGGSEEEADPFYDRAVELVLEKGQASTSMIQRTFRIGYNRAARIIEMMEREGVVGKMDGVKPREILAPPVDRSVP